jgi:tetratricopeptide (TPR) repeat protein
MRFRGMDPPDAVSLLLKAAYPDQQYQAPPATPMRNVLAEGIAIELGYLPLAIAHAGATIRRNIYTLERYLKYYLPQRKSLLSHSLDLGVEEANIITTWEIPFRKIVSRVSTEHKDAVDLMHAFAFMHYETIPERIFQRSWAELRDTIPAPTRPYPDVLQPVWSEAAQARFRRAIGVLCDHSIIEYEREKGLCTMHPVVHNWARDRLSKTEQTYWLQCTTAILAECISPNLEASGRQFRTLLLPHINSCRRLQTSRNLETVRGATEMEKFAWVYAENGQWNIARELQKNVVQFRKKSLGRQHPNTIRAQNSLVQTHWNLFEIKAAGLLQYDVLIGLNLRRPHIADWMVWPVWAPTHTTYCLALSELTSILWLAGDRSRSRYTGERAVAGLKQRLGPEDPLTLKAMFYLARTYLHLGERDRCHELLLWVLKHQKRYFGMKHPDTLMTRNELGMLLCASKQHLAAAQRLVENVLETRKELLGDEHAYTLWSMNDLSKIYIEVGRAEDAVALLESVVPVAKRTLGDDHVGMRMTKSNLGRAYFVCERWKEAEETVRPLFEGTSSDHPDLIHAEYGYAHILYELGRMEEAEGYCVNMIDKIARVKMFSLDHPRTVSIAELLKKIYRKQGREDKIATIRKGIPSVGVTTDRDWFDPYAVRRGSHQPARTHKISDSSGSPETASQLSGHKHTPSSSSSRLRNQDPVVKVIARRTF